jgi:hypothetical protein
MPTLFLTKLPKIYDGEKTASSKKCFWEKWLSACKKLKIDSCLSPCTSINSRWIKELNIRPKTLKLVQKRTWNVLEVIIMGKEFLNRTPAASN